MLSLQLLLQLSWGAMAEIVLYTCGKIQNIPYPCLSDEGYDRTGGVIYHREKLRRSPIALVYLYRVFENVTTDRCLNHNKKKHLFSEERPKEYLAAHNMDNMGFK